MFQKIFQKKIYYLKVLSFTRCDQENDREYCFPIPYTEMEKVPGGPRCKWVQKQECIDAPIARPKCEHPPNQMCVTCDTFRRDNGFGSCPTNNCGSFVPGIHLNTYS